VSNGAGALDFDGTNDCITFGQVAPNLRDSFCVSFWFKSSDINQINKYILSSTSTSFDNTWSVSYGYVSQTIEFYAGASFFSGTAPRNNSQITVNDTGWHFYAYTYGSSIWIAWKDGQIVSSVSQSFSLSGMSIGLFISSFNSGQNFLNGQLDDIRIYNRVLTPPEIRQLASRRGIGLQPRPKQFTYYQFPSGSKRRRILTGMP
jgi:hypothetical protein